jgi:predicted RNA-binding Zn ribbon-like protein
LLEKALDLIRWMEESGLASPDEARVMRSAPAKTRDEWLAEARALRNGLRKTFLRLAEGGRLRAADLDPLDAILSKADARLRVTLARGRARTAIEPAGDWPPAAAIARSAAEFFANAEPGLVRQCGGSGCILLFHDATKSHTRRWCSMAGCGNRAKAAAHYRRTKG